LLKSSIDLSTGCWAPPLRCSACTTNTTYHTAH
jgi:hypothetical protein